MSKLQIDFRRIPRGDEPIHVTPLTANMDFYMNMCQDFDIYKYLVYR